MDDYLNQLQHLENKLGELDPVERQAWERVKAAYVAATPPSALRGAGDEAARLSEELHKMALANQMPLPNSRGFERLLLRYIQATEAMAELFAGIVQRQATAKERRAERMAAYAGQGELVVADEAYQVSFCDDCGNPLPPTGHCVHCGLLAVVNSRITAGGGA